MTNVHEDWRVLGSGPTAWFGASSHGHAASLATAILDLLPDGAATPDLDIRGDGVRVRVQAPAGRADDEVGATLQTISDAARSLGLASDPSVLLDVRLHVASGAPESITPFWRTALDYEATDDSTGSGGATIEDHLRRCPPIRFTRSDDPRPLRNRVHLDSGHPGPTAEAIEALLAAGGREAFASRWYSTIADRDGNEVDVVPGGILDEETAADWRTMFGAMACYPGARPRQAAELAATAGRLADDAGIPLMIDLRPEAIVFDSGKDRWELVDGFADLAAAVETSARAAGLTADNRRLRFVQIGLDAVDIPAVRGFWRATLGYVRVANPQLNDLHDPRWLNPVVFVQDLDATDTARREQRNRISVELRVPREQFRPRIDIAVAAGGRTLDESADRAHIADPEGNELVLHAAASVF